MNTVHMAKTAHTQGKRQPTNRTAPQPMLKQSSVAADLLSLQNMVGNRAVNQLVQQREQANPITPCVNTIPGDSTPPIIRDVLNTPGQPLDAETKVFMESRFEHEFSHVRVHTDEQAAMSARAVNALAYTVGQDIAFGKGLYAPRTSEGKSLLAHELTHVVQQSFGAGLPPSLMSEARTEREADSISQAMTSAPGRVHVTQQSAVGVACKSGDAGPLYIEYLKWQSVYGKGTDDKAELQAFAKWYERKYEATPDIDRLARGFVWQHTVQEQPVISAEDGRKRISQREMEARIIASLRAGEAIRSSALAATTYGARTMLYGESDLEAVNRVEASATLGNIAGSFAGALEGKQRNDSLSRSAPPFKPESPISGSKGNEPLFPRLADEEVGAAIDQAKSGTPAKLPGQNPRTGEGLAKPPKIKADEAKPIAHHENMTFKGIKRAPGGKVEVRRHSANPNADVGTYSHDNPTTQVNSVKPKEYMLPDGTFKPFDAMTEEEKAAAHFP
jgi:hypothetical protein